MTRTSTGWKLLIAATALVAGGGAQCGRRDVGQLASFGPRVLTQNPTTDDVLQAVNRNSALIRSLYTTDAVLDAAGAPALRANIALERPRKLRLRAETALTGAELDLGSNDERFWFWLRRNNPPTLYHCRHDQFAASAARRVLPIDPQWLLDAVGPTGFDPAARHTAPQRNRNGHWEIRSELAGPNGPMSKITVVYEARGFVLEQHLYDERGTLVARALTSNHWRDPATGAVVPQQIDLQWPATQFSLRITVRKWIVNSIPADPVQLFTMPTYPGWAIVDLADPNLQFPGTMPAGASPTFPAGAAPTMPTPLPGAAGNSSALVPVPWNGGGVAAASSQQVPRSDLIGFAPAPAAGRWNDGTAPPIGVAAPSAFPATGGAAVSSPAPWLGAARY